MAISENDVLHALNLIKLYNTEMELERIPLDAEKTLVRCVMEGNWEAVRISPFEKLDPNLGITADNPLQQHTYMVVSCVAVATRAAIDGGALPEDAFDLSDTLLFMLSRVKKLEDIHDLYRLTFVMMAKLVASQKEKAPSYQIDRVRNYVTKNIYRKITLSDTAESLGLTPNYLSALFAQQMGISFHDYVQREKVEVACNLISQADRNLSEISVYLGFATQSNFSLIFRKWKGMTPSEYRRLNYREIY